MTAHIRMRSMPYINCGEAATGGMLRWWTSDDSNSLLEKQDPQQSGCQTRKKRPDRIPPTPTRLKWLSDDVLWRGSTGCGLRPLITSDPQAPPAGLEPATP